MHAPVAALNSFRVQRAFYLYHSVHCTQWDSETVIWDVLDSKPCPGQVSDQNGLAHWATLSAVPCTSPAIMHRDAPASFLLLAARGCKLWFDWHTHAACATFVVYTEESLVRLVGVQTVKLWSAQWYRCRGICAYLRTKVKAKLKWYEITLKIFSPLKKKKKKCYKDL